MSVEKRHHTIPRCYLENFTDNEGWVWVLDTNNKIFKIRPENILVENHFYRITLKNGEKSLMVENTLSEIESNFAEIYKKKISKNLFLDDEERAQISVFIAGMMHRTQPNREGMRRVFEKMKNTLEEWQKQYDSDPHAKRIADATPSSSNDSLSLDDINKILQNFDEEHAKIVVPQMLSTAQFIFNMKWSFQDFPDDETGFITSDDPLVMKRPLSEIKHGKNAIGSRPGLAFKDVEVTLPISKNKMLLAGWILNEDSYIISERKIAEHLNQRTILDSSKRIIGSSENQLIDIRSKYPSKQL